MELINQLLDTYLNSNDLGFKKRNKHLWNFLNEIYAKERSLIIRCECCGSAIEEKFKKED